MAAGGLASFGFESLEDLGLDLIEHETANVEWFGQNREGPMHLAQVVMSSTK